LVVGYLVVVLWVFGTLGDPSGWWWTWSVYFVPLWLIIRAYGRAGVSPITAAGYVLTMFVTLAAVAAAIILWSDNDYLLTWIFSSTASAAACGVIVAGMVNARWWTTVIAFTVTAPIAWLGLLQSHYIGRWAVRAAEAWFG
jgi:hypothetical protein